MRELEERNKGKDTRRKGNNIKSAYLVVFQRGSLAAVDVVRLLKELGVHLARVHDFA